MPSRAHNLEVLEEVLWGDHGVERFCVRKLSDPGISDNGEDELCRLLSRCLLCRVVSVLYFVHRFSARADGGRSVVVD